MDKDSSSESSSESAPSTPKTLKREREESDSQNTPSPKRLKVEKVSSFPLTVEYSPTTKERRTFSPLRRKFIHLEYPTGIGKKGPVASPDVREALKKNDWGNHWTGKICLEGRVVYTADLFDFKAKSLNKDGAWETNLERMEKGKCPIGYKGIVTKEQRKILKPSEIRSQQKKYRIEIHHGTQKDPASGEDPEENPLYMMTHVAHMGTNARSLIKRNPENGGVIIVRSSLEKEDALAYREEGEKVVTNVLHFRKGKSLINREAFAKLVKAIWKECAAEYNKNKKEQQKKAIKDKDKLKTEIIPEKISTSPSPAKPIKKEIMIEKEVSIPSTAINIFFDSALAGEFDKDTFMDEENSLNPQEGLFTSIAPSSGFLFISPPSSPFKSKEPQAKSPLKMRDPNSVKKELIF